MRSLPWNEGVVKAETCTAARTAEIRAAFENIVNVRSVWGSTKRVLVVED